MIFYYSATGNTRYAANFLAQNLNQQIIDITKPYTPDCLSTVPERIGFLFPIYCWGVPPVVKKFIHKIAEDIRPETYLWSVCTCGDETGIAMRLFSKDLKRFIGRGLDASFSLIMPNTYVLLPGFDVDRKEVEKAKLADAPTRLKDIIRVIENKEKGIFDVHEGSIPAARTRLLYPLFEKWGVFPKYWKASDKCIGCGKCAKICPAANIKLTDNRPEWGKNCYSCCGCFHVCPVQAVSYGSMTKGKSQYLCPLD